MVLWFYATHNEYSYSVTCNMSSLRKKSSIITPSIEYHCKIVFSTQLCFDLLFCLFDFKNKIYDCIDDQRILFTDFEFNLINIVTFYFKKCSKRISLLQYLILT